VRALRRLLLPLAAQSLVLLAAPGAGAAKGNAAACTAADDSAVELMSQQKLGDARAQLKICAGQGCPAGVRTECQGLAAQVDAAMPTIVFSATDASGGELHAVKVTVDGRLLAESLDGTALEVDPGEHSFSFATESQPAVTRSFVLTRGQKNRREVIAFAPNEPPPPAPAGPASPAQPTSGPSTIGMVTGGLGFAGVTGIALGGLFGMLTIAARNQETSDCSSPTRCTNHDQAVRDRSTAFTDGTISTVSFVAGGVLLAGAAVYYFVIGRGPSAEPEPAASGLLLAPSVSPGAGGMFLKGDF